MAIIVTHVLGRPTADWEQIVYEAIFNGTMDPIAPGSSPAVLTISVYTIEIFGTNLEVDGVSNFMIGGTVTSMVISQNGNTALTLTGLNISTDALNNIFTAVRAVTTGSPAYYTEAFKTAFLPLYNSDVDATGSTANDTLFGSNDALFNDQLIGNQGNDYIRGFAGQNFIDAGSGDDVVEAGAGNNDINGGQQDFDVLTYQWAGAEYNLGFTIDIQFGQTFYNGIQKDNFYNFEGYIGSQYNDIFVGSTFSDWLIGSNGADDYQGNGGWDTVDFSGEGGLSGVTVNLVNGTATDSFSNTDTLSGIEEVRGTDLTDVITGNDENNRLEGRDGEDTLNGGGGNDQLRGDAGNDQLNGGDGEDNLDGGAGDDTINAGAGSYDYIAGSIGDDVINGESGLDDLSWVGDLAAEHNGTDSLTISLIGGGLGKGLVTGSYNGITFANGSSFVNIEQIEGSKGDDTFHATDAGFANTADGDTSFGGARGAGGVISIIGGMGNDTYTISTDRVKVEYGLEQWLHDGFNNDNDRRWGDLAGEFGVVLNMAQIVNQTGTFDGRAYNLDSGQGLDTFSNEDVFMFGLNNLVSIGLTDAADLVWTNENATWLDGRGGDDMLHGGSGDDELNGGEGNDTLNGVAGHDQLNGQEGDDTINGGAGLDNINGDNGNDTLNGEDGNDNINAGDGTDTISGGAGRDNLRGDNDNDTVSGGTGNDQLEGGDGQDFLNGDEDDDEVRGNNDADRVIGGLGSDRVQGGDGNDILSGDDAVAASGVLGAATITLLANGILSTGGNDRLWGDSGDDLIFGGFGQDELQGGDNNDKLYGGAGSDRLQGDNGVDALNGGDGDDQLDGGAGIDNLKGDAGSDYLYGGSENDTLTGGAGLDSLEGGFGNDTYVFTLSDAIEDNIYDEGGIDLIQAASNVDMFRFDTVDNLTLSGTSALNANGNNLANVITGNGGVNILEGRNGNDTIFGGIGNDTLRGEVGNDTLNGGAGQDKLYGGTGNIELDVFTYTAIADSGITATTRDIIYDFHDGKDKINLSAIDANTSVAGNGAFGVLAIGTATSAVAAGKIGWYQVNSTNNANDRTFLRINTDADATIEMTIELVGLRTITTADFVL